MLDSADPAEALQPPAAPALSASAVPLGKCEIHDFSSVKWAWAGRYLTGDVPDGKYSLLLDNSKPRPADVVVVRVERVGHHHHIETEQERRLRLYEGDRLVGVFGNRYATDVYEGRVLELKKLHLLTASGLIGTVVSRHHDVGRPTALSFVGYLAGSSGSRINLKELRFQPVVGLRPSPEVVLVVGTGMNTGKTTVTRKILRALAAGGVRVAGCKLTGSASPRDLYEMRATGAVLATDFSDYGFPSTYGEPLGELIRLMDVITDAGVRAGAQLVVAEIADGCLQPETQMLLESEEIRRRVRGVVVAGACSSSLLFATEFVQKAGLDVWAASGLATNSPLFVREFSARSPVPVVSSRGGAARLARIIVDKMAVGTRQERRWKASAQVAAQVE
jgi:hypothetical protein